MELVIRRGLRSIQPGALHYVNYTTIVIQPDLVDRGGVVSS